MEHLAGSFWRIKVARRCLCPVGKMPGGLALTICSRTCVCIAPSCIREDWVEAPSLPGDLHGFHLEFKESSSFLLRQNNSE